MRVTQILKRLSQNTPAKVYYSGEYARDMIRRKKSSKIEIVVLNLPFQDIIKYIKKYFRNIYISKDKNFLSFLSNHSEITINIPSKGDKYNHNYTLRDDSKKREFTINAMYIPITSKKGTGIVDFYHGRSSIKNKKIETINKPENAIKKHPLLMLRALSLSAEINYRIDNNLFYAIKANSELIKKVSMEKVRDEFIKIILSKKPSRYLKIMRDSYLLNQIIPELNICSGIAQNKKYHKYDVFEHCLATCDNIEPSLILRLAALFHDIGKAQTVEEITKGGTVKVTFYNHEVVGSKVAKKIMRRLRFGNEVIQEVSDLIYNHMYNYEPNIWTDAAVRRFIEKVHVSKADLDNIDKIPLFLLRKADRSANGLGLSEISPRQHAFQNKIKQVYTKSKALQVTDLNVDGNILMKHFNLKPGPTIGHILNYLLSIVIKDQKTNTRSKLLEEASKYLSRILK
jgi:poly(A) polymerase/tRNA nucleotidyltransferase (CCA-adding enzyme)